MEGIFIRDSSNTNLKWLVSSESLGPSCGIVLYLSRVMQLCTCTQQLSTAYGIYDHKCLRQSQLELTGFAALAYIALLSTHV